MGKFRPAFANFQLTILLQSYCIFFVLFKYVVTGTLLEKSLLSIPCSASVLKWLLFIPKSIFSSFSCNMKEVLAASCVTDPYHFDTVPDSGCEEIRYGSGSRKNFDTDPDPGKNDTEPDPGNLYGFYGSRSATPTLTNNLAKIGMHRHSTSFSYIRKHVTGYR